MGLIRQGFNAKAQRRKDAGEECFLAGQLRSLFYEPGGSGFIHFAPSRLGAFALKSDCILTAQAAVRVRNPDCGVKLTPLGSQEEKPINASHVICGCCLYRPCTIRIQCKLMPLSVNDEAILLIAPINQLPCVVIPHLMFGGNAIRVVENPLRE